MYFFRYFLFYFPLSIIFIFGTSNKLGITEIIIRVVIALLFSLIISFIFYFIIKKKVNRGAKKLRDERESKETLTAYEVIANYEEIRVITNKGSNNFIWESVTRISETNNLFFIYTNQPSAIIIPKKAFVVNSADEFRNFLNKISSHCYNSKT